MKFQKLLTKIFNKVYQNEIVSKTIKNASWLISDKVFTMIIGVFVTAIVARYFGPENFGQFHYALSFVTLFTAISTLGLEVLTVKAIVDKKYDEGTILCTSLFMRVIGGSILTILAAIIIRIIEPANTSMHLLVFIISLTMVFKALEVIEYWIQAHQRAKISSIIRMVVYLITAGMKLLLVFIGGNLIHYSMIYFLDALIVGVALIIAYFKYRTISSKWRIDLNYAKYILSNSWYLILTGLMITFYMQIDKVMLGSMLLNTHEVGVYSAAVAVASMWYFVPMAIITSFQPVIMNYKNKDKEKYLRSVQQLYAIISWTGIVFGLLTILFSDLIIGILYGADYSEAGNILTISVWAGTFAMLGSARGVWLVSEGLQKYTVIFMGAGAAINVTINYILIPIWGGYGAAIATLVAQVVVSIITPLFFQKTRIASIMMIRGFMLKGFENK
ncbi:flippase [Salinicoccus roseus]|uniref:Polysaccharide biosynthesis protein n=1 Tax=Salinicoccus roseus TaxID=45670 RepID=A0A265EBI7_9STAP|nr:flippase [Salinicoccus roseus]OZT78638.1 polysaccharide biosynthesis protein [Salinicoccus roseus]